MNIPVKIEVRSETIEKAMDLCAKAGYIFYEPVRIRKGALAKKEALITKTKGKIEAERLEEEAINRLALTEIARQQNINQLTQKALLEVEKVGGNVDVNTEIDWIKKYFSFSQDISKKDMQDVWAKILAGEFLKSGSFSYKTMSILADMRSEEARLFAKLCSYTIKVLPEKQVPLIFPSGSGGKYSGNAFNFEELQHLDSMGLIHFENMSGFSLELSSGKTILIECDNNLHLIKSKEDRVKFETGKVLLTREGRELLNVINFNTSPKLIEVVQEKWITSERSLEKIKERKT